MLKIIDISPPLSESTPVWPGDTSLSRRVQMTLSSGDSVELSCLTTTVHIGAHADAPSHYHPDGVSMEKVPLDAYIGHCFVSHCLDCPAITVQHVKKLKLGEVKRVLFRTRSSSMLGEPFDQNFAYFEPEALEELGRLGVVLVGIDTPSVDAFHSKQMTSHHVLHKYNMRNLEGLELSHVAEGEYELIALPLNLVGFDGSPLRAVLRTLS